ncbi:hypothetical protein [Halomonas getboli]|uniref:hypothetical protein n=1 Tax=Halomonas getboli TaxID=2935862 RepID=UPI001FFEF559|nr:hypothetical protein [Halomonas getboli]MCK2183545.1 hypothetical protein [Halomonas getboli]
MIPTPIWKAIAHLASRPAVTRWLLRRAMRTPYSHIVKNGETYMERYWLFNPYDNATRVARRPWCPVSVRLHVIRKPDEDEHLHDHPWDARTLILRGWYLEERHGQHLTSRQPGDTAEIGVRRYHRITDVCQDGAVTLFITGRERGDGWGFLVDGRHVPWREYFARPSTSQAELSS